MTTPLPFAPAARQRSYLDDESGNVVIDWVVVTAGVVSLGIVIGLAVGAGAVDLGEEAAAEMQTAGQNL